MVMYPSLVEDGLAQVVPIACAKMTWPRLATASGVLRAVNSRLILYYVDGLVV